MSNTFHLVTIIILSIIVCAMTFDIHDMVAERATLNAVNKELTEKLKDANGAVQFNRKVILEMKNKYDPNWKANTDKLLDATLGDYDKSGK